MIPTSYAGAPGNLTLLKNLVGREGFSPGDAFGRTSEGISLSSFSNPFMNLVGREGFSPGDAFGRTSEGISLSSFSNPYMNLVGREGFEPPKASASRFTVCPS
jgi:hypothetical protein